MPQFNVGEAIISVLFGGFGHSTGGHVAFHTSTAGVSLAAVLARIVLLAVPVLRRSEARRMGDLAGPRGVPRFLEPVESSR